MGILNKMIQALVDVIFGVATYWFLTNVWFLKDIPLILTTILVTAIFAEFTVLKFKK